MTHETKKRTHPGLVWDEDAKAYKIKGRGVYVTKLPPEQRYRYVAAEKFRIEQQIFQPGDVLGVGNVETEYTEISLCDFEQDRDDFKVSTGIGAGHILPRLQDGRVVAEPIDD